MIDGVVRAPSEFSITLTELPSMIATHELVVPRSMPMILPIFTNLLTLIAAVGCLVPIWRQGNPPSIQTCTQHKCVCIVFKTLNAMRSLIFFNRLRLRDWRCRGLPDLLPPRLTASTGHAIHRLPHAPPP